MAIAQGQFTILNLQYNGQTFTEQPTLPYYAGDTWYTGADGDILTCTTTRENGTFNLSDWEKLNKYTDDTQANFNAGEISSLKSWQTEARSSIATITSQSNENTASITSLTTFQTQAGNSITQLQQKADAQGGMIQSVVADIQGYCVGLHSQAYGLTLAQAQSILSTGMVYVPTDVTSHNETYEATISTTITFRRGHYYVWSGTTWTDAGANTVLFSGTCPANGVIEFWIPTSDVTADGVTYTEGYLYKWKTDIDLPSPNSSGVSLLDGGRVI